MKIYIDTSRCTSLVAGGAFINGKFDTWRYKNVELESGKIYGLISEYQQGNMYLSYLLGGQVDLENVVVKIDEKQVKKEELASISWNLEPLNEKYGKKTVKKSIEKALKENDNGMTFNEIAKLFYLTENRYKNKLRNLSGERWRASAALGYSIGKKIFYAPYMCSKFYYEMSYSNLFIAFRNLANKDTIVLLPAGTDSFLKHCVDECIYVDSIDTSSWTK